MQTKFLSTIFSLCIALGIVFVVFTQPVLAQSSTLFKPISATAEVNNADAPKTLDDNPNEFTMPTYWQAAGEFPCITFDLGQVRDVVGIRETSGPFPGNPFTLFASTDMVQFTQVLHGILTQNAFAEHAFLSHRFARFIKMCIQRTDATGYGELADFRALVSTLGKYIHDDATGGDCTSIGIWNATTKTCTLTKDVVGCVKIASDGITLNGNGYSISGCDNGPGVSLEGRSHITIKGLTLKECSDFGVRLDNSNDNNITHNRFLNNSGGIYLGSSSNNVVAHNNFIASGTGVTIYSSDAQGNQIKNNSFTLGRGAVFTRGAWRNTFADNSISNNEGGITLWRGNENTISNNTISNNRSQGINLISTYGTIVTKNSVSNNGYPGSGYAGISLTDSERTTVMGNTISNNELGVKIHGNPPEGPHGPSKDNTVYNNTIKNNKTVGISVSGSSNDKIYNNNFIGNPSPQAQGAAIFNLPAPIGGNYWSDWTRPDNNHDKFVDQPYVFQGGQDNLPWIHKNGWLGKDKDDKED